ncbi:MAG TPA: MFS transporter [Dehalococcoidia bacterium]|nr:MFS transporter [Dehalococcoidia bacterium]
MSRVSELIATRNRTTWLLLIAGLGVFFAADDQTTVVALLPKMIEGLNISQDEFYRSAWLINGYILGYVIAMPLMGRVSDVFGHGRIFALALAVFTLGSAWVAVSQDLTMATIARSFQALGGGAIVPVSMAIVSDAFPPDRRVMGIGAMAAVTEAGGLIGPLWGGGLAELIGWRGVFWINLPMCIPLIAGAWWLTRHQQSPERGSIDVVGGALFGASLVCLTVALTNDPVAPRSTALSLLLYGGAAVLFLMFLLRQVHATVPLVDLRIFRRRALSSGFVATAMHGGVTIVAMVTVPLFTNVVLGGSALEGGINLARLTIGVPLGAFLGGVVAMRIGFNRTAMAGAILLGIGFLGMSRWDADPGFVLFTLPLVVAGVGLGLVIAPVGTAVMNEVSEGRRATVFCLLTVVDLMGSLVGVALLTTHGLSGFYASAGLIPLNDPHYTNLIQGLELSSFRNTFEVTAAICFAIAIPAAMLGHNTQAEV